MSDRYIPGVPCWADITPPDAEAAVEFYGGLFGWEFENVAPPGAPTPYYIARLRGEDVGAIGSDPAGAPAWNTYIWVDDADADRRQGARRGRQRARRADGRRPVRADGRDRRPGGRRAAPLAAQPAPRRDDRQRARRRELQHARDHRRRRCAGLLRRRVRLGPARLAHDVGAPRLRRLPGGTHPRHAREHGLDGRPGALRGGRRGAAADRSGACRAGASRSVPTTPTRSPPARSSSAARSPWRRSTPRGCG